MTRCHWPLFDGCSYGAHDPERYCYFHAKVLAGLIDVDVNTARRLGIRPARLPSMSSHWIGAPGQGISDEQLELGRLLRALGAPATVVAAALNRELAEVARV